MSETNVPFVKMNGLGNQIIVADMRSLGQKISADAAVALDGHADTKFDQIMELHGSDTPNVDNDIRILNSDGSEAEACGNGTRCVVSFLHREDGKREFLFRTKGGLLNSSYTDENHITVDMGIPRFGWEDIPLEEEFADTTGIELQVGPIDDPVLHTPSVANIGNPHAVFWVKDNPYNYDLERFGPMLENHPVFPERANISVAQVTSPDTIISRTWERGAGITQACGSGACAVAVCAARKGMAGREVTVTLPGGDLHILWGENNRIQMTGPAEREFSGLLDPVSGEFIREGA